MNSIQKIYYELELFYNINSRKYGLIDRFFCRNENVISWHKYESHHKFKTYEDCYNWIINNNQYSFKFQEGHCVQLYYEFDTDKLSKASLNFYPNPDIYDGNDYVRFDCDLGSHRDYIHTSYHAHFGYNSNYRISIYRFPMPQEFLNFIIVQYYNDLIDNFEVIKNKKDSPIMTLEELKHKYITHLKI